ncbi:MAG: ATP-binding protein [Verrucomicrobiota bacterium]
MQIFLIILLLTLLVIVSWYCRKLVLGVEQIASALRSKEAPSPDSIDHVQYSGSLTSLKSALSNLLTEIDLERKLERRQRRFFEGMLNQIEDALIILDNQLEIRFSNQAARQLFASDRAHEGRQLIEVCLDHRITDAVSLALDSQNKTREELRRPVPHPAPDRATSDGRHEHNYMIEAQPLIEKDGFGRGAWVLIRDITRQAETEQIRRDFVANASHELRTPLSIINGYLEMLDEDEGSNFDQASARRSIKTMRNHTERITRIVEDMLTISKLESNNQTLKTERFNLLDSINDSINRLSSVSAAQQATIKIESSKPQQMIDGDHFYWDQIFFNLIENALKQNPKLGLTITISLKKIKKKVHIAISDDGIGIPSEDLANIFQRFYRVEKHHAQTIKGTGLGLSIVKRAVEAHQGEISASSQPGVKTTFTIIMPSA